MNYVEIAEIMVKKGFESTDINESGFIDELSWVKGVNLFNIKKKDMEEIKLAMEEIEGNL